MCHNHSHAKIEILGCSPIDGVTYAVVGALQPLTLETPGGKKWTQPRLSIFLMPLLKEEDYALFQELLMEGQSEYLALAETEGLRGMVLLLSRLSRP